MRRAIVWGVIVLVWMGCGGAGLKGIDRGSRASSEDFDPLTLDDDDISPEDIRRLWMAPPRQTRGDPQAVGSSMQDTMGGVFSPPDSETVGRERGALEGVSGWRVQLSSYRGLEAAEKAMEEVRRRFDVPVYNEFEAPWYKIRIGDCWTEAEADELMREARRKGYPDAFRVRTGIVLKKQAVE